MVTFSKPRQMSPQESIAHYRITSKLGEGGMGEVWRATDTKLNREVAIKVLPAALANNAHYMARFEREAQVLAALNHPNIATVYGIEQGALVMELVEGANLHGPLPLDEAISIARQIATGLEAAHEKGIIHRDLKPANIKITPAGVVKILDFGLAKSVVESSAAAGNLTISPTMSLEMTRAGVILGTAAYMSPEQARGKAVDKRTDIWSFGVVLYEIVTGKRLFEGEDLGEILASVVKERLDLTGVSPKIRRLLERCLEKDPQKRLRDIGDMEFLLAETPAPITATAPLRSWLRWIAATAILAAGIAGLAFFAAPHFREKPPAMVKFVIPPPENGRLDESRPPAVSPDGRRIAFLANVDGKRMVWVRDLDSLDAHMLPGTQNTGSLIWSPDSTQLAFVSGTKLMKIAVTGGPVTTLVNGSVANNLGAWGPNGVILFAKDRLLARVSAAGGTPSPVTELDTSRREAAHGAPEFLPDGHHFLYVARSPDLVEYTMMVGDLQSKDEKPVLQAADSHAVYVEPGYLLFVREHALLAQPFDAAKLQTTGDAMPVVEQVDTAGPTRYFHASRNGTLAYASGGAGTGSQITWYDRSGKAVGTVGKPVENETPRLSPNGKMVASGRTDQQTRRHDIWLTDLVRGSEQRLTFAGNNRYPVWSPDGLRVAYSQHDKQKVAVRSADGTGQEEILESAFRLPMDWTRDGRYLVSTTSSDNPKTGNDLWALPLAEGKPAGNPVPLRETEFNESHGRVSPDGHWLAYQSNETKRNEVYVVGFPSLNGHWQVSVDGGRCPVWSRDGRELYFVSTNNKMMAAEIKPGPQFEASVPKPLFDVRLGNGVASYDVSADGRFLIATPVEQSASVPMTVVLNWQAALKK